MTQENHPITLTTTKHVSPCGEAFLASNEVKNTLLFLKSILVSLTLVVAFGALPFVTHAESLELSISSPSSGTILEAGKPFSFSGQVVGGVPWYDYWFYFGDSTKSGSPTGSSATLSGQHIYANPGSYTITFAATDINGLTGSASIGVTVSPAALPPPPTTYQLTVFGGQGSGSYTAGTVVTIEANAPPARQLFDLWTGATVANPTAQTTTLTMPAGATKVTATFADVIVQPLPPSPVSPESPGDSVREVVVTPPPLLPPTLSFFSPIASPNTPIQGASVSDGVMVTGSGFNEAGGNTIHFLAPGVDIPVTTLYRDGNHLTFIVPDTLTQGLFYEVRVQNSNGTSNSIPLVINPSGVAPITGGGFCEIGYHWDPDTEECVSDTPVLGSDLTDGCGGPLFLSISGFLARIQCILNLFIPFIIGLAVFVILFGIFLYVAKADNEEKRQEGRRFIIWGLVGLFFMLSVWGFVNILLNTLDIERKIQPGDIPVVPTVVRTPVP